MIIISNLCALFFNNWIVVWVFPPPPPKSHQEEVTCHQNISDLDFLYSLFSTDYESKQSDWSLVPKFLLNIPQDRFPVGFLYQMVLLLSNMSHWDFFSLSFNFCWKFFNFFIFTIDLIGLYIYYLIAKQNFFFILMFKINAQNVV